MIPATPKVEIRFGVGAGFANVLVLGDANDGILGTNVPGTSSTQIVDITSLVQKITTRRGRDRVFEEYSPGTATVRFIDTTGDWNPQNASGPYYGKIYTPVFEVIEWVSMDGEPEPAKVEEAPAPAAGRRRRSA